MERSAAIINLLLIDESHIMFHVLYYTTEWNCEKLNQYGKTFKSESFRKIYQRIYAECEAYQKNPLKTANVRELAEMRHIEDASAPASNNSLVMAGL